MNQCDPSTVGGLRLNLFQGIESTTLCQPTLDRHQSIGLFGMTRTHVVFQIRGMRYEADAPHEWL
jgi:hypothetical protein